MAILEMIPPEYWRRLKKELARLNLDDVSETALPWKHPDNRNTAIQFNEAMEAIIEERIKKRISKYKNRIKELEWVAEKRKEKIGELECLLCEEIKRRENAENSLGEEVRQNFEREQDLMKTITELEEDSNLEDDSKIPQPKNRRRGRPKKRGRPKGSKNKKKKKSED